MVSAAIPTHPNQAQDLLAALDIVEALDTMPMELTKTFGDLRELDAVLNGESVPVCFFLVVDVA